MLELRLVRETYLAHEQCARYCVIQVTMQPSVGVFVHGAVNAQLRLVHRT